MIVDAHVHVWSDDTDRYPYDDGHEPKNEGGTELLRREMATAGVDRAVIVQPIYHGYDHRYVLETALDRYPDQFAGVALVDPFADDAPAQLRERVTADGFGGMRLYLSKQDDPARLAGSDQDALWETAADLDVCFIIFGQATDLPAIAPMFARFPDVPVIIDHLGAVPPPGDADHADRLRCLLDLANQPNVTVKVSNMNRLSAVEYPHDDMVPVVKRVYDAFGAKRLMWGTDFPHVMRSCGYQAALDMVRTQLDWLNADERSWLFGRTAADIWFR